jgi:hypothetical protein
LIHVDAKSGKKLWHFNTVPLSLWGNPKVNSGGGVLTVGGMVVSVPDNPAMHEVSRCNLLNT